MLVRILFYEFSYRNRKGIHMKIVTYEVERRKKLGIFSRDEQWIYPLESFDVEYKKMENAVEELTESEIQFLNKMAEKDAYEVSGAARRKDVKLLAPIERPRQDIICLGINYMDHAEESARFKKEKFDGERPYAVYFSKRVNEAIGDGQAIPAHEDLTQSLDYEVELAVILGKDAFRVSKEQARECVFGYTIINDVSARDVQNRHKQWYFGKSLDGFLPMGPCIVTADEIAYPPKLAIRSFVNGELRQDSNTELLIFDIDHVISELSQGMTLKAGTIISMGTPAGVGMGFDPPRFLKPGDVVTCQVEGIGYIANPIE